MSKKKIIIISIIVGILVLIAYRWQSSEDTPDTVNPESEGLKGGSIKSIPAPPPPIQRTDEKKNIASTDDAGFLPTQMEDPERFEVFQKNLKDMAQCLNIKINPLDPQSELNFETFNSVISPDLGDVALQEMVWTISDIRTKSGETRRIYVQHERNDDGTPKRTLKYYSMGQDGSQKEIPLTKEQTSNPQDSLIASLESDGELLGNSSAVRAYYKNGNDLSLVERSGKIYSFELPHQGKSFSCTGADDATTMKCVCQPGPR